METFSVPPLTSKRTIRAADEGRCRVRPSWNRLAVKQVPDLQNILPQSYDYFSIMSQLRSTYDGRLIYKASREERKVFLRYSSLGLAYSMIVLDGETVFVNYSLRYSYEKFYHIFKSLS